ncbi:MAG: hypothetical protein SO471_11500 [Anaerobutyricum hallii]|uniref:hypothetical protein n=1 Tax=Anaerobutyricum hallii TaxID=39488 RepID=UPI002A7EFB32|nr:hypothetical protein [Anaerobutyricum hallii]MCI6578332.1 hypothetical protein [Bacteroidales bacterium]MDY4578552.1 hypothetical protein [Anaerobutyricum hallii]
MDIDFVELGKYCQTEYRASFEGVKDEKYIRTLFVAIKEDNSIMTSYAPHILRECSKCILIHERTELAITNWYCWYKVQFINEQGEVLDSCLDDEFKLSVYCYNTYSEQLLYLSSISGDDTYCRLPRPFEYNIKLIWQLYLQLKDTDSRVERKLIADLFQKDQKILELKKENEDFKYKTHLLEQEKNAYKDLLDEIKGLVECRKGLTE